MNGTAPKERLTGTGLLLMNPVHIQCCPDPELSPLWYLQGTCNLDQGLGEICVNAPVAHLVGVGECVAGNPAPDANMIKLRTLCTQAGFDVVQAFPIGQLTKGHTQVLVETVECLQLVISPVSLDTLQERVKGEMVEQLGKNEFARVHGAIQRNRKVQHLWLEIPSSSR